MIDRITVLGGSSVYTPEFVVSLISRNINVKEVVLLGRKGRKLPVVAKFCQRLMDRSGFPARVTGMTNLEEAVAGAKFVVNQIRVGGLRARLRDERIPPKQGMIGDESVGAGGFANAMRTLPIVLDYAQRIEQVNPDATIINLTNPMGLVVEALCRHTNLKVAGVSDLPLRYAKKIARLLHRNEDDVDVHYIGLNHMGWIQDVRVSGQSCISQVLEKLERHKEDGFDFSLIELFRMVPTRAMSLYFHRDQILKKQQGCPQFRAEVLQEAEKRILKLYEDEHLCELPDLTRERNAMWYEDTIVPLIAAFGGKKKRNFILCVRNDGAIRDLPEGCSVEVPVSVNRDGLTCRKVGNCPHFLKGLFLSVKESDRLTVEAVLHKSYEYALQALAINPLIPSLEAAKKFLDCVIKEEKLELH